MVSTQHRLLAITLLVTACIVAGAPQVAAENLPYLVKDINPNGGSNPLYFVEMNGKAYLNADGGVHGQELWQSGGTEAGT